MPKYNGSHDEEEVDVRGGRGRKGPRRFDDEEPTAKGGHRKGGKAVVQPGHEGARLDGFAGLGEAFGVKPEPAAPKPAVRPAPQGARPPQPAPQGARPAPRTGNAAPQQPRQETEPCPTCNGFKPVKLVNQAGVESRPLVCFSCHGRYVAYRQAEAKAIAAGILKGDEPRELPTKVEWVLEVIDPEKLHGEATKAQAAEAAMLGKLAEQMAAKLGDRKVDSSVRAEVRDALRKELGADEIQKRTRAILNRLAAAERVVAELTAKAAAAEANATGEAVAKEAGAEA